MPVDLGKRQRRKVVYNEAELGRARASNTESSSSDESEFEGDEAAEDEDGSASGVSLVNEEGAEGKKVLRPTARLLMHCPSKHTPCLWLSSGVKGHPTCCVWLGGLLRLSGPCDWQEWLRAEVFEQAG